MAVVRLHLMKCGKIKIGGFLRMMGENMVWRRRFQ